jgi:hypothetical protein
MPREPEVELRWKRILSRKIAGDLWQLSDPLDAPTNTDSKLIRGEQHGCDLPMLRCQDIEGSTCCHGVHAFNAHAFGNQRLVQRGTKELML